MVSTMKGDNLLQVHIDNIMPLKRGKIMETTQPISHVLASLRGEIKSLKAENAQLKQQLEVERNINHDLRQVMDPRGNLV